MSVRNLSHLLEPASVALIGASPRVGSVGNKVLRNLLAGGFLGPIDLVNPKYTSIDGRPCQPSVTALALVPDLAVIATPAPTIPGIVEELGRKGTRAAVVLSAGFDAGLKQRLLDASRPHLLRILGPNGIGLMLPHRGLDATFAATAARPGHLALVSQSGAIITAVVDWAERRKIGFSHVISLGDMAEVDFGDLLDYLATDPSSKAILLYMEAVTGVPKFMSAARRAARAKPVIVIKSGRHAAAAQAAASHTGRLAGEDAVYDAAFRRSGLLRVLDLDELLEAAEMLARIPSLSGERLTILTNGGGAGVLAADRLADFGGEVAPLSQQSRDALDKLLPQTWSRGNPVDIIGDADASRYQQSLAVLLDDPAVDAVLVIRCPTAVGNAIDAANAVVETVGRSRCDGGRSVPVLANWLGGAGNEDARALFSESGVPTFDTPGAAARGFMHLVRTARLQTHLMRTPPTVAELDTGIEAAAQIVAEETVAGHELLTEPVSKRLLAAAGVPMTRTLVAASVDDARDKARELLADHPSIVLKVLSSDITHKSDVGGVRLGLATAEAVAEAAADIETRATALKPGARLDGFTLAPYIERPDAFELIIGAKVDATFGPVLLFGAGGTSVEVVKDTAIAILPLDRQMARDLIGETRVSRLLNGFRNRSAANLDAIAEAIVRISDLMVYCPQIVELDVNPLLADARGVIALDARVRIAVAAAPPRLPLAIAPYPRDWHREIAVETIGAVDLRPIRPADETLYADFLAGVTPEDMRLRFFSPRPHLSHALLARWTQIDYAREMAFIATAHDSGRMLGVARFIADPDFLRGEFGVLVRSDLKGRGLGWQLMRHLLDFAETTALQEIYGAVLSENTTMLRMCRDLGFTIAADPADPSQRLATFRLAGR